MTGLGSRAKDLVVLGLLTGLMAAREIATFRFNGSLSKIGVVLAAACFAMLVCMAAVASWKKVGIGVASRVAMAAGLIAWARSSFGLGSLTLLTMMLAASFAGRVPQRHWESLRRAVFAGCLLWSVTPGVLALMTAPHARWLAPPVASGSPEVTVFLLLDEFNANAADPVEAALQAAEVIYRRAAIEPFDSDTIRVVPAMFTGKKYDRAGACGATRVCSMGGVLDFSRITVGRPDVDLVGAAMPYCAIQGLRYCKAIRFVSNPFDVTLWRCAVARRWGVMKAAFHQAGSKLCMEDLTGDLDSRSEAAIERAPVWQQSGLLFVHLILPHPPGRQSPHGSLAADYSDNVIRAAGVTTDLLRRLKETRRTFRLVIFSDHPLRRTHCDGIIYDRADCMRDDLFDDQVPLFVAGDVPPTFNEIRNNVDIFRLASP
jgi:hypothetical protein